MFSQRIAALLPPFLLIAVVGTVAAGVQRYVSPPSGLQLPLADTHEADVLIRIGSKQYPRWAIDRDDITIRIPKPTHRIVSQNFSTDDFVYSVAPPQDVVAVSESAYAKGFSNVYDFVERFHPAISSDPERVLALNPDLLIVSSDSRADYTSLARSTGVPLYRMETLFPTLDSIEQTIRLTGYLTGNDEAAEKAARHFRAAIDAAKALRPPNAPKPRVLGLGGTYSYGKTTLFQDICDNLGAINVGAENGLVGYDAISFEQIVRWDPEWIIAGADPGKTEQTRQRLLHDPAISLTQAARNNHIVVLENHVFLPISPYSILLVQAMAQALYGAPRSPAAVKHE